MDQQLKQRALHDIIKLQDDLETYANDLQPERLYEGIRESEAIKEIYQHKKEHGQLYDLVNELVGGMKGQLDNLVKHKIAYIDQLPSDTGTLPERYVYTTMDQEKKRSGRGNTALRPTTRVGQAHESIYAEQGMNESYLR